MLACLGILEIEKSQVLCSWNPTLGPITLSARNDVRKTKKMSEQNPSAEATHVFVPLDNLLPLKRLINLNWGLAVDLRRQRVPKNSKTWIPNSDKACSIDREGSSKPSIHVTVPSHVMIPLVNILCRNFGQKKSLTKKKTLAKKIVKEP